VIHQLHKIGLAAAVYLFSACQSDSFSIRGEALQMADGTRLCLTRDLCGTPSTDTILIAQGHFALSGETDSTLLCSLSLADKPESGTTFFLEPGNIYIELSPREGHSRVSGTPVNNQWQALNDTVARYDHRLRILFNSMDSLNPRRLHQETSQLYNGLTTNIREAARRNSSNAIGRFILTHHQGAVGRENR
jgi:hypothetical protein